MADEDERTKAEKLAAAKKRVSGQFEGKRRQTLIELNP